MKLKQDKRKILITAGGTATTWHLCNVARQYYAGKFEIHICDINAPYLVPAATLADKCHKVSLATSEHYVDEIAEIVSREKIDVIVPLIPYELLVFAKDSETINRWQIDTTAPSINTVLLLSDKKRMYSFLKEHSIETPEIYSRELLEGDKLYIIKPRMGFGSRGVKILRGSEIEESMLDEDIIIQEYCQETEESVEVTTDIFNGDSMLKVFSRKRVAIRAGVSIKMEPIEDSYFEETARKLIDLLECPYAFNLQFIFHKNKWKLFDCNLRLSAGTALSSASGFQLARAFLGKIINEDEDENFFVVDKDIKSVLRVYQEIVVK